MGRPPKCNPCNPCSETLSCDCESVNAPPELELNIINFSGCKCKETEFGPFRMICNLNYGWSVHPDDYANPSNPGVVKLCDFPLHQNPDNDQHPGSLYLAPTLCFNVHQNPGGAGQAGCVECQLFTCDDDLEFRVGNPWFTTFGTLHETRWPLLSRSPTGTTPNRTQGATSYKVASCSIDPFEFVIDTEYDLPTEFFPGVNPCTGNQGPSVAAARYIYTEAS